MMEQAVISTEPFFDEDEATRRLEFFPKYLRHSEDRWAGKPFNLMPWETQLVRDVFGWQVYDVEIGAYVRLYTEAFVEIPGKCGKSELGAGIGLNILVQDGQKNGNVLGVAENKDQAKIVLAVAKNFCEGSTAHPALAKRTKVYRDAIEYLPTGNIYRVLPGDENTNDGEKAIAVVFDEVHRIKRQGLYDVMKKSLAASSQGLFLGLTTAGDETSLLAKELHDRGESIKAGTVEGKRFYYVRYGADEGDPWDDEEIWKKANPSLGITKTTARMRELAEAARVSPTRRAAFKRLHLNIWNQSEDRLIDLEAWDACPSDLSPTSLHGCEVFAGLDMSATTDITAAAYVTRADNEVRCLWDFWMPEETAAQREKDDCVPYTEWARDGWISLTPGNVVDYAFVRRALNDMGENVNLVQIGYDPWNATQLAVELQEHDGFDLVPMRQGFQTLSPPTKELLGLVADGRFNHGGNPVARWMAHNTVGKEDENSNIKPVKGRSKGRIDGIVAAIMAIGRLSANADSGSVYDERGIRDIE